MYDQFYSFTGRPFQLTPDPAFYFESGTHRKAMSYLGYGLAQGEGFIVITGDIGAGKTTLVGHLMNSIDPNRLTAVKLVSTAVSGEALLQLVAEQFGLDWDGLGKAELLRTIEQFLREQARAGRRTLLIVDEGQNLPIDALEELRMLSNFQLGGHSLLQIFLLGQPEFRHTLFQSPSLEQLRQRVIATHHLDPMEPEEVEPYILHRLGKVGWQGNPAFSPDAFELLFDHSDGVPRRLNVLVSRVLLFGAVEQLSRITGAHVRSVVAEMSADGGFAQPAEVVSAPQAAAPAVAAPVAPPAPAPAPAVEAADPWAVPASAAPAPFTSPVRASFSALPAAPEAPLEWPRAVTARPPEPDMAQPDIAPFAPPVDAPAVKAVSPVSAAPLVAPFAPSPGDAAPAPFAAPASLGLERFAPLGEEELFEPLPMPVSAGFIEARSLVADHLTAAAAPVAAAAAAPVAPFGGNATPIPAEPAVSAQTAPQPAPPPFAAPFAQPAADRPSTVAAEPAGEDDLLELDAPFELHTAPLASSAEPLALVPAVEDDTVIALQRRIAGLEARLADQDAALRRVLDLLIDWVERDPAGAPAVREWAA